MANGQGGPVTCLTVIDKQRLRAAMRERRRDYAASLDVDTRAALEDQLAEALAPLFATAGDRRAPMRR